MYEQLSARGSAAASGARDAARASRSAYYDNPLVGGFVAALLGAVAGAVIPASQKEEDYLGDTGAKVLDTAEEKARTLGNETLAKKDEVVQRAEEKMSTERDDLARRVPKRPCCLAPAGKGERKKVGRGKWWDVGVGLGGGRTI